MNEHAASLTNIGHYLTGSASTITDRLTVAANLSAWAVNAHGHVDPAAVEQVRRWAQRLTVLHSGVIGTEIVELANKL